MRNIIFQLALLYAWRAGLGAVMSHPSSWTPARTRDVVAFPVILAPAPEHILVNNNNNNNTNTYPHEHLNVPETR